MDPEYEERECNNCGETFQSAVIRLVGQNIVRQFCPACQDKIEEEQEKERLEQLEAGIKEKRHQWRSNSGMTGELASMSFDNFDSNEQSTAVMKSREWASSYDIEHPHGYPSLIFYSARPGLGKTHLMAAIANYIIENWHGDPERGISCPIRFESGPGLVRRIRSTFNLPPDSTHEREEDVYNQLRGVRLLILDDVGKETPSKFTRETYWYVIDERLKNDLPVIISSRIQLM